LAVNQLHGLSSLPISPIRSAVIHHSPKPFIVAQRGPLPQKEEAQFVTQCID
jgi:hypothetical protein